MEDLSLFLNRRTVRAYSDREVTTETIQELMEAASRTSTTGNMQLYSVVVTRKNETKEALAPLHFNQPVVKNAPVVLTFCADFNRFTSWCKLRNANPGYGNFQGFFTAALDALIAAQTFCVAAEARGLGICYIGTTTYNTKGIAKLLKLPNLVVPVTTITLGYPASLPDQVDRLPVSAIIHEEEYADYTTDELDTCYLNKELNAANQQFVKDNEKETLAQVFTDVRYPKAMFEKFSVEFMEAIQEQGYNF
jgi:nitroreductase